MRKIKCIDCQALDWGFTPNDSFVHCCIKHSQDMLKSFNRKQPEITLEMAYEERFCSDFIYEKKKNPESIFHTDVTSTEYRENYFIARMLAQDLEREAKKHNIKIYKSF